VEPLETNSESSSTSSQVSPAVIKVGIVYSSFTTNLETISITFNDKTILKDVDGNDLQTTTISNTVPFFLVVLSDEDKAAASQQSSASIVTMLLTFGTSTLISILLGGTVEATWLLFGAIQLMSFVPLFNLNLPANFREFAKNLAVLHGEPEAIPNLFEYYVSSKGKEPYSEYFDLMGKSPSQLLGFHTTVFILNAARKIELWTVMILSMGVSFLLFDTCSEWGRM
jgi:hypothetical protein